MWSRAAACQTPAALTPVLLTATAGTTGTATPALASPVCQFVALFLLVSVETAHPCFTLFDRLLRQQLHRRVLVEPLQARINVYEEAELLPRLHLRLFQELLWSLLREKVSFLDSNQRLCAESGRCLLCFTQHCSLNLKRARVRLRVSTGLTFRVPGASGATRPAAPVTVRQTRASILTATRRAASVGVR